MRSLRLGIWVLGALAVAGCGPQRVRFLLIDAPLDNATSVNVTLTGMKVFTSQGGQAVGESPDGGAVDADAGVATGPRGPEIVVFAEPRSYDLLALRNGASALLGDVDLYGRLEHISLTMDGTATVVYADGTSQVATVPSGVSSGLKIQGPMDPSGVMALDFDAAASIHEDGLGGLVMKPVIHVVVDGKTIATSDPIP